MLEDLKNALPMLGVILGLVILLYLVYSKSLMGKVIGVLLPWLPMLFRYLANKTPDQKKVFDKHDWYVLGAKVSYNLNTIIKYKTNLSFDDVEEDLAKLISEELKIYKDAGVHGVPEINSDAVREQTKIIFGIIKGLLNEQNSSGNNQ